MAREKINFGHIGLAHLPVPLTLGIFFVLAEGRADFGGGEKDILLALPYLVWATIFFIISLMLIIKRWVLCRFPCCG